MNSEMGVLTHTFVYYTELSTYFMKMFTNFTYNYFLCIKHHTQYRDFNAVLLITSYVIEINN